MTEQTLKILVCEPDGATTEYTTTTRKSSHDVAREIGRDGYFALGDKAQSFRYYPPARVLLITLR